LTRIKDISINQIIKKPEILNSYNDWGFVRWYCSPRLLERKSKRLVSKLKFLVKLDIIDGDKYSALFSNEYNYFHAPLYKPDFIDKIVIAQLGSMKISDMYSIIFPKNGDNFAINRCNIYYFKGSKEERLDFQDWAFFKKQLKNNNELQEQLKQWFI